MSITWGWKSDLQCRHFEDHRSGAVGAAHNGLSRVDGGSALCGLSGLQSRHYVGLESSPGPWTEMLRITEPVKVGRGDLKDIAYTEAGARTRFRVIEITPLKIFEALAPEHLHPTFATESTA